MKKTEPKMTLSELLALMAFYKQTQPTVRTGELLKIAGFKIAGLAGTTLAKLTSLGHRFAWHEDIQAGICTCGKWRTEKWWSRELSMAQQQMHARQTVKA
jgi:hypothetical protein